MSGPIGPGPGADGFRVDTDGLAAHAGAVAAVAERVRTAAGKALPVPQAAFGQIGQLFAGDATSAATIAIGAVGKLVEANQRVADDLKAQQAAYAAVERANADQFSRMMR